VIKPRIRKSKPRYLAILSGLSILAALVGIARTGKTEMPVGAQVAHTREEYVVGKPFDLGNQWIFLADDDFVEDKIGVIRVMGNATKITINPIMAADLPWEDYISAPSVIYDDKAEIYHMWYQGFNSTAYHAKPADRNVKHWYRYWTGYATSRDGVHWEKPRLDLFPYLNFAKTNIVNVGDEESEAHYVWLNDDQSNPARRFLMTYGDKLKDPNSGQSLMLAYSADGIHWHIDQEASPLITHIPDGSFQAFLDKESGRWLMFRRPDQFSAALISEGPYAAVNTKRRYSVSTNDHLGPGWTSPRIVIVPDEEVEVRNIDHMRVRRVGTHYIAMLGMMDDSQKGLQDVHLAASRDGLTWTKFPYLPAFLPRGDKGSYDAGQVFPPSSVDQGEYTFLYYGTDVVGQRVQQGYASSIAMARLRRGRWIGLQSDTKGGYMLTRELVVSGGRLEVNFQGVIATYMEPIEGSPLGYVRLELLRRSDSLGRLKPIPGFTMAESDSLVGDGLSTAATWKGKSDLTSLRGSSVFIRVHIVNSQLWGLRFADGQ